VQPVQSFLSRRRRLASRLPARHALTFIDLVIVVMIIGLTVSIAMPRMTEVRRKNSLRNAALMLAEHLRLARNTAITRAMTIDVVFNPEQATYSCAQLADPERPNQTLTVDLRASVGPLAVMNATFNGANTLSFGVDGLPRTATGAVTTSTIRISEGSASETVTLTHGWGTAQWQTATSGSPGVSG
jgi:Tfp pilus assembly protein FimT